MCHHIAQATNQLFDFVMILLWCPLFQFGVYESTYWWEYVGTRDTKIGKTLT